MRTGPLLLFGCLVRTGVAIAAITLAGALAPASAASTLASSGGGSDVSSDQTETSVYTHQLSGDISDCVGLYPKPNCGTKPQLSGDRGGVMQLTTFGLIIVGLGVIMTAIARGVRRTDRAKIRQAESDLRKPSQPKFNN